MVRNKKNILIILMFIVIVLLVTGIVFLLIYTNNLKKENSKSNNIDSTKVEKEETDTNENISVSDYINKKTYYSINGENVNLPCDDTKQAYISLKLPKIDSNKPGAKEINEKIINDNNYYINLVNKEDFSDVLPKNYMQTDITYNTIYKDNLLIINIETIIANCASGGGNPIKSYIYNTSNDKAMANSELVQMFNLNIDEIKQSFLGMGDGQLEINDNFNNNINTLDESFFDIIITDKELIITFTGTGSLEMPQVKISI